MTRCWVIMFLILGLSVSAWSQSGDDRRAQAEALWSESNYLAALDFYSLLLEEEENERAEADFNRAAQCLQRLGRWEQFDALVSQSLEVHGSKPIFLWKVALWYDRIPHEGILFEGDFFRHRAVGKGQRVRSILRDRNFGVGLFERAMLQARQQKLDLPAQFFLDFAQAIADFPSFPWHLQYLSNWEPLPEFALQERDDPLSIPLDGRGKPLLYSIPKEWRLAKNDGERWRWLIERAKRVDPGRRAEIFLQEARFWNEMFGVKTIERAWSQRAFPDEKIYEKDAYGLRNLQDDETLGFFSSGIQKVTLPAEFHPIAILREIVADEEADPSVVEKAWHELAHLYEQRGQGDRALECWERSLEQFGENAKDFKERRLGQLRAPRVEMVAPHSFLEGEEVTFQIRYRNVKKIGFVARRVDVGKWIRDTSQYLQSNPIDLDVTLLDLDSVHQRPERWERYLSEEKRSWEVEIDEFSPFISQQMAVTAPLDRAGTYWVEAQINGEKVNGKIMKVIDSVLIQKPLKEHKALFYFVDARTGEPLGETDINLLGYRREIAPREALSTREENVIVEQRVLQSNSQAIAVLTPEPYDRSFRHFQWLAYAESPEGVISFLDFNHFWGEDYYFGEYRGEKSFVATDRNYYRPGQNVFFRGWMRRVAFSEDVDNQLFGQIVDLSIEDPEGNVIFSKSLKADSWGGFSGKVKIPQRALPGEYRFICEGLTGGGKFAVVAGERSNLSEVVVKAPENSTPLGESIPVTLRVQNREGKNIGSVRVRYQVQRFIESADKEMAHPWSWYYQSQLTSSPAEDGSSHGDADQNRWMSEIVLDGESDTNRDGEIELMIDTSWAQKLFPDKRHRYRIEAKYIDDAGKENRVYREAYAGLKPFDLFIRTDGGYLLTDQISPMELIAKSFHGEVLGGVGKVTCFQQNHDARGALTEKTLWVQEVEVSAGEKKTISYAFEQEGQYRIAYLFTDTAGFSSEESVTLSVLSKDGQHQGSAFQFLPVEILERNLVGRGEAEKTFILATNYPRRPILFFVRPVKGVYREPELVDLSEKINYQSIVVSPNDTPNFFIEAVTVWEGKIYSVIRNFTIPPRDKVCDLNIELAQNPVKPAEEVEIVVKASREGMAIPNANIALAIFESQGEEEADREFINTFWKWERRHASEMVSNTRDDIVLASRKSLSEEWEKLLIQRSEGAARATTTQGGDGSVPPLFWQDDLVTDGTGKVRVVLTMPEKISSWKIRAYAMGLKGEVGEASVELATKRDIVAKLETPQILRLDDDVVISALVKNDFGEDKKVKVTLKFDGQILQKLGKKQLTQTVLVAPGNSRRIRWLARAKGVGRAVVQLSTVVEEEKIELEEHMEIYPRIQERVRVQSGVFFEEGSRQYALAADYSEQQQSGGKESLEVSIDSSLAQVIDHGLSQAERVFRDHAEDRASLLRCLVMRQKIEKERGEEIQKEAISENENGVAEGDGLEGRIDELIQDIALLQNRDGTWPWIFSAREDSVAALTVYMLDSLLWASENGFEVDKPMIEKSLRRLEVYYRQFDLAKISPAKGDIFTSVLRLFASQKLIDKTSLRNITALHERLSPFGKLQLAHAAHHLNLTKVRDRFLQESWQESTAYQTMIRDPFPYGAEEFFASLIDLQLEVQNPLPVAELRELMRLRSVGGIWTSGRGTAYALEALQQFSEHLGPKREAASLELDLSGKPKKKMAFDPDEVVSEKWSNSLTFPGEEEAVLSLHFAGEGPLAYHIERRGLHAEEQLPSPDGFTLQRTTVRLIRLARASLAYAKNYRKSQEWLSEPLEAGQKLQIGDIVEVTITIDCPRATRYLVVEDYLGGGFEVLNVSATLGKRSIAVAENALEGKVIFYLPRLSKGVHELKYRLRAQMPGKFHFSPAQLYSPYGEIEPHFSPGMNLVIMP